MGELADKARAQRTGPAVVEPPPGTTPPASTPSYQPGSLAAKAAERRKALKLQDKPPGPGFEPGRYEPVPYPETQTFWGNVNRQINPVKMATEFYEMADALKKDEEAFLATNPSPTEIAKYKAARLGEMTLGTIMGIPMTLKEAGEQVYRGEFAPAAGTLVGGVAQYIIYRGLGKYANVLKAQAKSRLASYLTASRDLQNMERRLPTPRPVSELMAAERSGYNQSLAKAFKDYESIAGRQTGSTWVRASSKYRPLNELLSRFWRDAGEPVKLDANGNVLRKTNAETFALTDVTSVRGEMSLKRLVDHDKFDPYPSRHPVRKFLDELADEAGNDAVEFQTLKRAVGKMKVIAADRGASSWERGVAKQLLKVYNPFVESTITELARAGGVSRRQILAILKEADTNWASYKALTKKDLPGISAAEDQWRLQHAASQTNPRVPPGPESSAFDLRAMEDAALETRRIIRARSGAEMKISEGSWLDRYTTGKGAEDNFLMYLTRGGGSAPQFLSALLQDVLKTKDFSRWNKIPERIKLMMVENDQFLLHDMNVLMQELENLKSLSPSAAAVASKRTTKTVKQISRIPPLGIPHFFRGWLEDKYITPKTVGPLTRIFAGVTQKLARTGQVMTGVGIIGGAATTADRGIVEGAAQRTEQRRNTLARQED